MKTITKIAAGCALALQLSAMPAQANDAEDAMALGALAILGVAALAHNQNHYHNGYKPADDKALARFERGYRDGLHNEPYDTRHSSYDYGQGYDAGQKERQNRLAHKQRDIAGTKVPRAAVQACRDEVMSSLNVGARDVHVVNAGQEGSDNFYIEFASGHKHVICGSSGAGKVFNLRNGRM